MPDRTEDAWREVGDRFRSLGDGLRHHRDRLERSDGARGRQDIAWAFRPLVREADRLFTSLGNAMRDREVRAEAARAVGSLMDALGTSFSQMADEWRRRKGNR